MPSPDELKHINETHEAMLRRTAIVKLAFDQCHKDGEVEVDENAEVSEGDDNGAYVQAWVWVDFGGTQFDKESNHAGS